MQVPVVMPQLGLTMSEGSVSEWLKKPGDQVEKNEAIFVVSTDKADMEVEATENGILSTIVVERGKTVPVGTVIAYLEKPGAQTEPPESATSTVAVLSPQPINGDEPISSVRPVVDIVSTESSFEPPRKGPPASPRARRLAKELGIDISTVQTNGSSARIVEEDVKRAAQASTGTSESAGANQDADANRRRIIADKLTESVQTIPHFSVAVEVNAQQLMSLYSSLKANGSSPGVKLSLTDLMLKALALALRELPEANATWQNGAVAKRPSIDLGLAIATDRGVVGPSLRGVDQMSLAEIARQRTELIDRAQRARLSVANLEGAVGTLSNLGMYGVDEFQGIITPGQSFILTAGRIQERPWVERTLVIRSTLKLNLSMDHRVADGVTAARLIARFAEILETPYKIVASQSELQGG